MREEDEEDDGIQNNPPAKNDWVTAVLEEEQLCGVRDHNDELYNLCRGHVPKRREAEVKNGQNGAMGNHYRLMQ